MKQLLHFYVSSVYADTQYSSKPLPHSSANAWNERVLMLTFTIIRSPLRARGKQESSSNSGAIGILMDCIVLFLLRKC